MGIRKILTAGMACIMATAWSLSGKEAPRIVNIINFIRQTEPRSEEITDEVLYRTVESQAELMARYGLKGTFLLQYDALINPDYQSLMKQEEARGCEVGGWWEITEPHVKAAGIEWRGRYPWDWHADVGFATGYSPEEREKLVDVYMEKFRSVFGYYPSSVGSWFIDAHTLGYMHDRYGITASCNCTPGGNRRIYVMGRLLEPGLLSEPSQRLYAGADRGGADTGTRIQDARERSDIPV